ncbi:hypothetical protein BH09BAC3_BH09BAC3_15050 [soil metagenome]
MQFLNPIFLWGLLGLFIPIGIHLLSRKEGKVIKLGSLRHLQETSTKQFKGIKLNELVLLSLRCLLIVIFCSLLSGLYWNSSGTKKWILVEKGIESQNNVLLDSLKDQGYELHWLSRGLPSLTLKDTSGFTSEISYTQAIEDLNKRQVSEAIVFAKNNPTKFAGPRTSLPPGIRWISVASEPQDYTLFKLQFKTDSAVVRKGHTDYAQTAYADEKIGNASTKNEDLREINVALISDEHYQYDKKIMKVALEVIGAAFYYKLNVTEYTSVDQLKNDSLQWIIWLSDKAIPINSSKILALIERPANELLIQRSPNHWSITKRLTEETALNENLTLRLAELIMPGKDSLQKIANRHDRTMIPDSIAWSNELLKADTSTTLLSTPFSPWLMAILFLLLVIERTIAYHRNQ